MICIASWGSAPAATAKNRANSSAHTILVLGDSISAEYGLPRNTGWVQLLRERLRDKRLDYTVENASISGETTSGGRVRLPELLARTRPAIVIVELGGNDGLRGLPLSATEENLAAIIQSCENAHARVLLVGMQLPPNYGREFTERFAKIYPTLAKRYDTALVPFFFQGFADRFDLFQADRIHPTVAAQPRLLNAVWPQLTSLLPPQSP